MALLPSTDHVPSLLAIDFGTTTGWARGLFTDVRPVTGVWKLPKRDPVDAIGARAAILENILIVALDEWMPDYVVSAEPFISRNMADARNSMALRGILQAECWRRHITPLEQPESTMRAEILGRGRAPTEEMKALVEQWCAREGITIETHDAGDAAVAWRWTRDELVRQWSGNPLLPKAKVNKSRKRRPNDNE